jgi:hypothetical protein
MDVFDAYGERLGQVKEVRPADFLLARPLRRDVYVPYTAVRDVHGRGVTLNVAGDTIDDANWAHPAILGTRSARDDGTTASAENNEINALDTRPGQPVTAGIDDGAVTPAADLLADREVQRRRDLAG